MSIFSGSGRGVGQFGLALLLGAGCKSEPAATAIVTQVQSSRPAATVEAKSSRAAAVEAVMELAAAGDADRIDEASTYCRQVEQQARETNQGLPQQLDDDTRATRVAAYGCDVVLEYAMLGLRVSDVAVNGVRAMRDDVLEKLCSDPGARGVLDHGGSFTNVYRDERDALIDQFTIGAEDCTGRGSVAVPAAAADL